MRWIVPCVALVLAHFTAGCASTPGYGAWVVADYCGNHWSEAPDWRRIEAPANAQAYRDLVAADNEAEPAVPDGAREYWFQAHGGAVKYCLTDLQRSAGRFHWCNPQRAVWWVIREEAGALRHDGAQYRVCLT
jgi:hypothetical protein